MESLSEFFTTNGYFSNLFPNFEIRPDQEAMAKEVLRALEEDSFLVCEAETGIGKTFAYLIPAILYSASHGERIIISTNTINLQEQIFRKDIPLLKKGGLEFNVVLLKGMQNYLCRIKVEDVERDLTESLPLGEEGANLNQEQLKEIIEYSYNTEDGTKEGLSFVPYSHVWEMVSTDSDTCLKNKCPRQVDCFYLLRKRAASKANIIITNHALLLSDVTLRSQQEKDSQGIFPSYQNLILDEAHHLEQVATQFFGHRFSWRAINKFFARMLNPRQPKRSYFNQIVPVLSQIQGSPLEASASLLSEFVNEELYSVFALVRESCNFLLEDVYDTLCERQAPFSTECAIKQSLRINNTIESTEWWESRMIPLLNEIGVHLRSLLEKLGYVLEKLIQIEEKESPSGENQGRGTLPAKWSSLMLTTRSLVFSLSNMTASLIPLLSKKLDMDYIKWFEYGSHPKHGKFLAIKSHPLYPAPLLKKNLYNQLQSLIATSATLTTSDNFNFYLESTGLSLLTEKNLQTAVYKSPFDYQEQCLIAIASDSPIPGSNDFNNWTANTILKLMPITKGKSLTLLTSYQSMNALSNQLTHPLAQLEIEILMQGQNSRSNLLSNFKQHEAALLLGTDSFWEGIDIEGDALKMVIIPKLPFHVPSEPIHEARSEALKKAGKNPFWEYALPLALIKFKQGMGRLIRSTNDTGVILILDSRISSKSYSRLFMNVCPCPPQINGFEQLIPTIRDKIEGRF